MTVKRLAQTIRLRPERREEYLALHREVWPGVEAALLAANVRNYTIFLRGDTLFGYFEYHGDDFEADMASIAGVRAPSCAMPVARRTRSVRAAMAASGVNAS